MEEKKDRKINYIILIAIIIAFTPLQAIANVSITSGISNIQSIEYCNNGRIPARKVNEKIEKEAKVVIISQNEDTNLYSLMMRYYLYPDHIANCYQQVSEKQLTNIKNKMLKEDISYVYVFSTNEQLNESVKKEFNNETELKKGTLYKLEKESDKVELKEIPLD